VQWIWVAAGGAAGALGRWGMSSALHAGLGIGWPWGTFGVNVVGCLGLGVVAVWADAATSGEWIQSGLAIGFLGAFTTFSTFSLETVRLAQNGEGGRAAIYVVASVVLGIGALLAGMIAGRWGIARLG